MKRAFELDQTSLVKEFKNLGKVLDRFIRSQDTTFLNEWTFVSQLRSAISRSGLPFGLAEDTYGLSPYDLVFNQIARYHPTQTIYREYLIQESIAKCLPEKAVAFGECPTNAARADLVWVNGLSTVFEIKSAYDTLKRTEKQVKSYFDVFEEVYIVAPIRHIEKLIGILPSECGYIAVDHEPGSLPKFDRIKAASKHGFISPILQASMLTVKELREALERDCKPPGNRIELEHEFASLCTDIANERFKTALRNRKSSAWRNYCEQAVELPPLVRDYFFRYKFRDFFLQYFRDNRIHSSSASSPTTSSWSGKESGIPYACDKFSIIRVK